MALFNMADQYSTSDGGVDLSTSDSKKRPHDGAIEGRPSYKRSNLGGMCSRNVCVAVYGNSACFRRPLCFAVVRR